MSDFIDPNNVPMSSAPSDRPEASKAPEGVNEQIEADDCDAALAECGLTEAMFHDCGIAAAREQANADPFHQPWFFWCIFSNAFFKALSHRLFANGWARVNVGSTGWLRSRDRQYGLLLWPGNSATGRSYMRAQNARAKGQGMRALLEAAQGFLPGLDPASVAPLWTPSSPPSEAAVEEGEEGVSLPKVGPEEYPKKFIVLLVHRRGNVLSLEVQILPRAALSPDGFLQNTERRILMHSIEVESMPSQRPIESAWDAPPPPTADDIDVPMVPRNELDREDVGGDD